MRFLIRQLLPENDGFAIEHASQLQQGILLADTATFDLILLNLNLPDSKGFPTFQQIRARLPQLPVIILSASNDRAMALRVVSEGAEDYVVRDNTFRETLVRAVRYGAERTRDALALHESEDRYRLLFESNPSPAFVFDNHSMAILAVNEAAIECFGWSRLEFLSMNMADMRPADMKADLNSSLDQLRGDADSVASFRLCKKDGTVIDVESRSRALIWGNRPARISLITDVTERNRAQEALANSERFARATVNALYAHCHS